MFEETKNFRHKGLFLNVFLLILLSGLVFLVYQQYFLKSGNTNANNENDLNQGLSANNQNTNQENINANQALNINESTNSNVNAQTNQNNRNKNSNSNINSNTNSSVIDPSRYKATTPNWQIYVSTAKYFTIEYPATWYETAKPAGVYLGSDRNLEKTPPVDIIKVIAYSNTKKLPLDQWLETSRPEDPDATSTRQDATLAGQPAFYIKTDYSTSVMGGFYSYYQEAIVVGKEDKVYEINCLVKNSTASALNDFRKIYPTFNIIY